MSTGRLGAGDSAIQSTIVDAKGDLIVATAADTPARLAVGTNNLVLMADSTQSTGLKWGGTWTSFTPSWGGITIGNGTNTGNYFKVGKLVTMEAKFVFGSTSAITGGITLNPISGTEINFATQGVAYILDSGIGTYAALVWSVGGSGSSFEIRVFNSASTYLGITPISSTVPMTWATGDEIRVFISYEEA
jgi:hypothetical protein